MSDWRVEAIVELEDMGRRLRAIKEQLSAEVTRDDEMCDRIMKAIREHDESAIEDMEWATGGPCCGPSAPGPEALTHPVVIPNPGLTDEPPSRPA